MNNNSNNVIYLSLEGHVELEKYRYLYFFLTLTVYMLTICCNAVVISVIYTNKLLHEPMYVFIAALLCNASFGISVIYPKLMIDLLSEIRIISFEACTVQAFLIHLYAAAEFTLLSAMAYDRYVSICKPLQYVTIVKMSTVRKLLFCCWFVPSCEICVGIILTYRLKPCSFKLNRIYCNTAAIVKLSCTDTTVRTTYGMVIFSIAVFPPVIFVIFSYVQILSVCLKNSKESRRKALQTCFPHILIFTSFTVTSCFEVINNRLEAAIPHIVTMIISVENVVISSLLNPIVYGLKLRQIYIRIVRLFLKPKTYTFKDFNTS